MCVAVSVDRSPLDSTPSTVFDWGGLEERPDAAYSLCMSLKDRMREVIFEADTPEGHRFDVILLWLIVLSVIIVSLESISSVRVEWGTWLYGMEWALTAVFTVEYLLRLW